MGTVIPPIFICAQKQILHGLSQLLIWGNASNSHVWPFGIAVREGFYEEALSRGLTHEQAQVYAQSFDMDVFGESPERLAAIQELAATYAERDDQGNIMRDDTGAPILSEQNQEFVDYMVHTITESSRAGSTLSGSYLTGIGHYNHRTGRGGSGVME